MADGIIYPEKGINGENLLRESILIIEPQPVIYSVRVDVAEGRRVRIIIPVPDDPDNSWSFFRFAGMSVGWKHAQVFGDDGKEVHFLTDTPGYADLPAYFTGHNSVEIKIFENDDQSPSRIKPITW